MHALINFGVRLGFEGNSIVDEKMKLLTLTLFDEDFNLPNDFHFS